MPTLRTRLILVTNFTHVTTDYDDLFKIWLPTPAKSSVVTRKGQHPVFAAGIRYGENRTKIVGKVREVETRDAPVVAATYGALKIERYAEEKLANLVTPFG